MIPDFPARQGFTTLLSPKATLTVPPERLKEEYLPVDLSTNVLPADHTRLAGMVLMLTQFPSPAAVKFTFGGKTVDEPFMRSKLRNPITAYDLLLPAAAKVAM